MTPESVIKALWNVRSSGGTDHKYACLAWSIKNDYDLTQLVYHWFDKHLCERQRLSIDNWFRYFLEKETP